jgi:cytochrome oxidase Cu insertion factor (SCO1/SenC/PrrC family)
LLDQNGEQVSLSDFEDKVVVIAFTYTICPDVCLAIEANLDYIDEQMADEEDLVILSITIDPARDTPEHLWGWTNVRGYDWPHLTSYNHSELQQVWSDYSLLVDNDHINSDHSDHGEHGDHSSHDDHSDHDGHGDHSNHSEMSHQVAVLYPDNTTALFDGDHDMLPEENATGWNLTETTMSMNNISLNYSVHEEYGNQVHGINGIDAPSDWSWWWSLHIWNESSEAWEESSLGIDQVMIMHDTDHIAWAASNANLSMLPIPTEHADEHDDEHDDHDDHNMADELYEVGHNTVTFIVDKDGKKRVVFTGSSWSTADFMDDLNHLLHHDSGAGHSDHSDHDHH